MNHPIAESASDSTAPDNDAPGRRIVTLSWCSTVVFAASAVPTMVPVHAFDGIAVGVALGLFAASIPLWLYAFVVGVGRSRDRVVTISGLFFLRDAAPAVVRRLLLGSLAATLVITVITASAEPFGVLVPVLPLAFAGLWGARHGTFPPRPAPAALTRTPRPTAGRVGGADDGRSEPPQ